MAGAVGDWDKGRSRRFPSAMWFGSRAGRWSRCLLLLITTPNILNLRAWLAWLLAGHRYFKSEPVNEATLFGKKLLLARKPTR